MRPTRSAGEQPGTFVDLPGGRLYVDTAGRRPETALPLVVLIHGAGHDHTVWAPLADHLGAHGMSVMNVDLPGHGRTGGPPAPTIEGEAALVAELIESTRHGSASVIGHSKGALIALELAATRPELVERLVLIGAGAALPVSSHLLDVARHDLPAAHDLLQKWSHSRTVDDSKRRFTRAIHEDLAPGVLHTALASCDRYTSGVERALSVRAPTLLIRGEHDVMVAQSDFDDLAAALGDPATVVIPGSGHNTALDTPGEVANAIERFFADHSSSV